MVIQHCRVAIRKKLQDFFAEGQWLTEEECEKQEAARWGAWGAVNCGGAG